MGYEMESLQEDYQASLLQAAKAKAILQHEKHLCQMAQKSLEWCMGRSQRIAKRINELKEEESAKMAKQVG